MVITRWTTATTQRLMVQLVIMYVRNAQTDYFSKSALFKLVLKVLPHTVSSGVSFSPGLSSINRAVTSSQKKTARETFRVWLPRSSAVVVRQILCRLFGRAVDGLEGEQTRGDGLVHRLHERSWGVDHRQGQRGRRPHHTNRLDEVGTLPFSVD